VLGEHLYDEEPGPIRLGDDGGVWKRNRDREATVPTVSFLFKDFDGEVISAITKIEEMEWRRGTGYFKWLSAFYRPKISRSLGINFTSEVGKRKGSWKGGTTGHSIEMLTDEPELHLGAFMRYCKQEGLEFVRMIGEGKQ
jgi:hypothetical protein